MTKAGVSNRPHRIGRRLLMTAGLTAGLGALTGCSLIPGDDDPQSSADCVNRSSLQRYSSLAGAELVYEENNQVTKFAIDATFAERLATWKRWWDQESGSPKADRLGCFGTWIDGGGECNSWHNSGRAFDLTRLDRNGETQVSFRYDRFGDDLPSLRRYWRVAASLHLHFAYVLTYLFDELHHNHIHVDNSQSGNGDSTFSTESRVQVHAVQAICTYLWQNPVELTGEWDSATQAASQEVLGLLGENGQLTDSQSAWQLFLTESIRKKF